MNSKIKNIPISERPRERFKKYGKENLQTCELISIILSTGTKDKSVIELSNNVLNTINDPTTQGINDSARAMKYVFPN